MALEKDFLISSDCDAGSRRNAAPPLSHWKYSMLEEILQLGFLHIPSR